jgi:hypothetical protein
MISASFCASAGTSTLMPWSSAHRRGRLLLHRVRDEELVDAGRLEVVAKPADVLLHHRALLGRGGTSGAFLRLRHSDEPRLQPFAGLSANCALTKETIPSVFASFSRRSRSDTTAASRAAPPSSRAAFSEASARSRACPEASSCRRRRSSSRTAPRPRARTVGRDGTNRIQAGFEPAHRPLPRAQAAIAATPVVSVRLFD